MDLSACALALGDNWRGMMNIALYSHLVPAALILFLGIYALIRTKRSPLAVAFLCFSTAVTVWLVNDVILWTAQDYHTVAFFWSWIDLINVIFFALGAYFFVLLARGRVPMAEKIALILIALPVVWLTLSGNAITDFSVSWCEATENPSLTNYKVFAEGAYVLLILLALVANWRASSQSVRIKLGVVALALVLFFATFSVTEYLATVTNVYEINLYGLFILPVFLIVMVFSITNLGVFKIRYLGTQLLLYLLILLVASQLLFLESSTDATLSVVTLGIAVCIGIILIRNENTELLTLVKIEELAEKLSVANTRLQKLDHLKSQFLSFASHQLKAPMTSVKWTASLIADGSLGKVPDKVTDAVRGMENTASQLMRLVDEFLNLRKLEEGRMEYQMEPIDLAAMVGDIVRQLEPTAHHKGLALTLAHEARQVWVVADRQLLSQVVMNLVDNAIKYTDKGSVAVTTANDDGHTITVSVSDTGHGMDASLLPEVFEEFNRDRAETSRIEGTGLGLYIAKQIVIAHHGALSAQSPGRGKGSTFRVVLPLTEPRS
jgi:signal transduction histidine kinase